MPIQKELEVNGTVAVETQVEGMKGELQNIYDFLNIFLSSTLFLNLGRKVFSDCTQC